MDDDHALSTPLKAKKLYGIMYYKKNNCIGLRERAGLKRQVLSFGGTHCAKSRSELDGIAALAIRRLAAGQSIEAVRAWTKSQAFN